MRFLYLEKHETQQFMNATSKEIARPGLQQVRITPECAQATDGHMAVQILWREGEQPDLPPEGIGLPRDILGEVRKQTEALAIGIEDGELLELRVVERGNHENTLRILPVATWPDRFPDLQRLVDGAIWERQDPEHAPVARVDMNAQLFAKALHYAQKGGDSQSRIEVYPPSAPNRAILLRVSPTATRREARFLVMPIMIKGDSPFTPPPEAW